MAAVVGLGRGVPQRDLVVGNIDEFLIFRVPDLDIGLGYAFLGDGDFIGAVRVVGIGEIRLVGRIGRINILQNDNLDRKSVV